MSVEPRPNNTGAAIRGVLLVLVAVVIGILLLQSSSDDDPADAQVDTEPGDSIPADTPTDTTAAVSAVTSTSQATTATIAPPDPTTTTAPAVQGFTPRPASEVTVQVANSTRVSGAAGRLTDRLKALNYVTGSPTNMSGVPLDTTRVFYQSGSLLEAQRVAEVLELDRDEDVAKIFTDTSSISNFETPDVLVALGLDLAE